MPVTTKFHTNHSHAHEHISNIHKLFTNIRISSILHPHWSQLHKSPHQECSKSCATFLQTSRGRCLIQKTIGSMTFTQQRVFPEGSKKVGWRKIKGQMHRDISWLGGSWKTQLYVEALHLSLTGNCPPLGLLSPSTSRPARWCPPGSLPHAWSSSCWSPSQWHFPLMSVS